MDIEYKSSNQPQPRLSRKIETAAKCKTKHWEGSARKMQNFSIFWFFVNFF